MKQAEQSINQVSRGIRNVFRHVPQTKARAILFGSRARGDAGADSDWDILILLDKDQITQDDINTISYPIRTLGWDLDKMINPIMYTTREWEARSHTPFFKNVMHDGIEL